VWVLYRWAPRDIVKLCAEHLINEPKIHVSVFERIANGTNAYAPGNIPFDCTVDHSGSLTKWPDPTAPGKISSLLIAGKTGSASSLLEKMDTTVKSGNRSYRAFLIVTLAAIAAFITLTIFWSLPYVLWSAAGFLICAGLIYRWALKVDNALYDEYAEFWHGLRDQLRAILK